MNEVRTAWLDLLEAGSAAGELVRPGADWIPFAIDGGGNRRPPTSPRAARSGRSS